MVQCHDVTIKRKLNGWLVQVGCREFVFSLVESESFYALLKLYFRDPETAMAAARAYEYDGEPLAPTPMVEARVQESRVLASEACEGQGRVR